LFPGSGKVYNDAMTLCRMNFSAYVGHVDGIELVDNAKLLGVMLQNNFSVEMHVT